MLFDLTPALVPPLHTPPSTHLWCHTSQAGCLHQGHPEPRARWAKGSLNCDCQGHLWSVRVNSVFWKPVSSVVMCLGWGLGVLSLPQSHNLLTRGEAESRGPSRDCLAPGHLICLHDSSPEACLLPHQVRGSGPLEALRKRPSSEISLGPLPCPWWEENLGPPSGRTQLRVGSKFLYCTSSAWSLVKFQEPCQLNSLLTLELVILQERKVEAAPGSLSLISVALPVKWGKQTHQQTTRACCP